MGLYQSVRKYDFVFRLTDFSFLRDNLMQTAAVRRKIHECHGFSLNIQNQAPGDPDQASDWFCHHFQLNEIRAEIIVR